MSTKVLNFLIAGTVGSGKTSFIRKFIKGEFSSEANSINAENESLLNSNNKRDSMKTSKTITFNKEQYCVNLKHSKNTIKQDLENIDCVFITYDLKDSIKETSVVSDIIKEVRRYNQSIGIILLGMKLDLIENLDTTFTEIVKDTNCLFLQASAKNGQGINEAINVGVIYGLKYKNKEKENNNNKDNKDDKAISNSDTKTSEDVLNMDDKSKIFLYK